MPPSEECAQGAENRTNIENLEKVMDDLRCEIRKALKEIRDKLLGRPSWVVLFLFSAMSSVIVALLCLLLTHEIK